MSLFAELKRRNVFRVGIAYAVVAWLVMQVADVMIDNIGAPPWLFKFIVLLLAIGLPVALLFAWAFEMTPEGLKRESEVDRSQSITNHTGRKLDRMIIFVLVLAVGYFIWESRFSGRHETPEAEATTTAEQAEPVRPAEPSIAVLPFVDMSPNGDQGYFSDGIAEELLNLLVQVKGLDVASRTSSFSFKDVKLDVPEIASELKVDHIVEGSVRKAGDRVRITAQLVDATTDRHLWSETYDRELKDIFGIQDEIANAVVNALRDKLGIQGEGKAVTVEAATENLDAYDLFLQAHQLFLARLELPRAVSLFEQAVKLDPGFARAWAGLAANYSVMESWSYRDRDYSALAQDAANRAIELNPQLSTPWAVKAQLAIQSGDQLTGTDFLQKAIGLDPDNPTHHLWYGIDLSSLGYQDRSLAELQRCLEIDPAYENCRRHLAMTYMILGDNQKMMALFQQGAEAGFMGSDGAFMQRFMTLGNRMLATRVIYAGEEQVSSLPGKAILDAMEFPDKDHSTGLAKLQAWLERTGQPTNSTPEFFLVLGAYDQVKPAPFSNRWIWLDENRPFRKSPYFKPFVEKVGYPAYWRAKGFPKGCRPVAEEDFECD